MLQYPPIPPSLPNYEWLKTLVSVGVGLVIGVVSALFIEPMKVKRIRKLDGQFAEESIYVELGQMLTAFRTTLLLEEKHCVPLVERVKFEKYDYYFGQRREVFYAMPDNVGIRRLHGQIALNLEPDKVKKYGAKHTIQELVNAFEWGMQCGELSKQRIEAAALKYDTESKTKGPALYEHIQRNARD